MKLIYGLPSNWGQFDIYQRPRSQIIRIMTCEGVKIPAPQHHLPTPLQYTKSAQAEPSAEVTVYKHETWENVYIKT